MVTSPVLLLLLFDLLLFDLLLFVISAFYFDSSEQEWENLLLSALFLFSGMPALIYQVVWHRVLFSIYGVNAESVAVVVSAFMLGLGLGSIAGGRLSFALSAPGNIDFWLRRVGHRHFRALVTPHLSMGRYVLRRSESALGHPF